MRLVIFGLGYTTTRMVARLGASVEVVAITRTSGPNSVAFDNPDTAAAIVRATHILSSVPPAGGIDPVLARYGALLADAPARWLGYLSSTGVYGDASGAWVDEASPVGGGRRSDRVAADAAWLGLRDDVRVFRLPGIYGPGRSAIDRVRDGAAHRIDAPGHRFSRIHVDDIGSAVIAAFTRGAPGIYNLADAEPASGVAVIDYACALLGVRGPPLEPLATAALLPAVRGFYKESRLVSAAKFTREVGTPLAYPDFRAGLRACL